MAIEQISRIQVRRGLQENLPTLAPGELGWAVDTRKLYIGNGTVAEGSPTSGVTEVLTQFSAGTPGLYYGTVSNLPQNTGAAITTGIILPVANTMIVDYATTAGSPVTAVRTGTFTLALNGSTVNFYDANVSTYGTNGLTFTAVYDGVANPAGVKIMYQSSGTALTTIKYLVKFSF